MFSGLIAQRSPAARLVRQGLASARRVMVHCTGADRDVTLERRAGAGTEAHFYARSIPSLSLFVAVRCGVGWWV